jgi:hypothetical protein
MQARAPMGRAREPFIVTGSFARGRAAAAVRRLAAAQNGMSSSGGALLVLLVPPEGAPAGWKSAVSTGTSERGVKPLPPPPEKS